MQSHVIKLEHTSFNLTCSAGIDPDSPNTVISFVWSDSKGNIFANYSNDKLTVLNFTDAVRNMSGMYTCFISDGLFNYSDTTNLEIQCKLLKGMSITY